MNNIHMHLKLLNYACPLLIVLTGFCAAKAPEVNDKTAQAHFRGFGIVSVGQRDQSLENTVAQSLDDLYGCKTKMLEPSRSMDSDSIFKAVFEAGLENHDDIIFLQKSAKDASKTISVTIYNIATLKKTASFTVTDDRTKSSKIKEGFSKNIPDPNIYPKGGREVAAKVLEKNDRLEYSVQILKRIRELRETTFLEDMDSWDALDRKIKGLDDAVKLRKCLREDATAKFDFSIERSNISDDYMKQFNSVISKLDLKNFLAAYTQKPAKLLIQYDSMNDKGLIMLEMRFWPEWYAQKTSRAPKYINNKRVISFEPYFLLMNLLIRIKEDFANAVPLDHKKTVMGFETVLNLKKPCDERLRLTAVRSESGSLVAPYYLEIQTTGYGEATLKSADDLIYNRTDMFTLGPSRLLSGEKTVYGVLYDFLEIRE